MQTWKGRHECGLFTLYRQQLASFPLNSKLTKQLVSNTQEACWNSDGELRQELKMASSLA